MATTAWLTQILKRPNISAFLEKNKISLYSENFEAISRHKINGCEFVILDSNLTTIYTTSTDVKTSFSQIELKCILDYPSKRYYNVSRLEKYKDSYLVTERCRVNGEEVIGEYCVLDKEYNILWGPFSQESKNSQRLNFSLSMDNILMSIISFNILM